MKLKEVILKEELKVISQKMANKVKNEIARNLAKSSELKDISFKGGMWEKEVKVSMKKNRLGRYTIIIEMPLPMKNEEKNIVERVTKVIKDMKIKSLNDIGMRPTMITKSDYIMLML